MESAASHIAHTDVVLPLRVRHPQLTVSNLKSIPDYRMAERKKSDTGLSEPSTYSMTLSTHSSVFSQETSSSLESRATPATMVHPSPPQTPKTKPEWEDGVRLGSVPWIMIDKRKRTHSNQGSSRAPTKRRCSELDESYCNLDLPSMNNIFHPQGKKHSICVSSDHSQPRWPTPSSSPEPSTQGDYTCSKSILACSLGDDLITRSLNALRMERDESRTLPPLPQPVCFGSQPMQSPERPPFHFQAPPPSLPPSEPGKKWRSKPKKENHINVKYATEELDYIRYHRVDRNTKWEDTTQLFNFQFPIPGLPRTMQGIQGGYYRQNNGQVPVTTSEGDLSFLPNGHVCPSRTKVREQKDKKLYGLAILFPERAMNYPWVDNETRQLATKLGKLATNPLPHPSASRQRRRVVSLCNSCIGQPRNA